MRKFGYTTGRAACAVVRALGDRPGRLGHNHTDECRIRITKEMEQDLVYCHLSKRMRDASKDNVEDARMDVSHVDSSKDTTTNNNPHSHNNIGSQDRKSTMEEQSRMWPHVKKVIAHVKHLMEENQRKQGTSANTNLGSQSSSTMLICS